MRWEDNSHKDLELTEWAERTCKELLSDVTICAHLPVKKKNSVALVRERTIPTERPPLVGEVSANFFADRGVSRGQRNGSPRPLISVF